MERIPEDKQALANESSLSLAPDSEIRPDLVPQPQIGATSLPLGPRGYHALVVMLDYTRPTEDRVHFRLGPWRRRLARGPKKRTQY